MNTDLTHFFEQFEGLEADNIGQWPKAAKITLAIFLAIVMFALGYLFLISDKIIQLDRYVAEEVSLKSQYQVKYHAVANLELFEQQMIEAESLFANQLRRLPESHETLSHHVALRLGRCSS